MKKKLPATKRFVLVATAIVGATIVGALMWCPRETSLSIKMSGRPIAEAILILGQPTEVIAGEDRGVFFYEWWQSDRVHVAEVHDGVIHEMNVYLRG